MNVVIDAGVNISLKAGGSFITAGPAGVSLKGPIVNVIADVMLKEVAIKYSKYSVYNFNG